MEHKEGYGRKQMNNASLVSVIIIFLNAEKFLQEAIESVLAQCYPHWELLLVDDGSWDGSTQMARTYAAQSPAQVRYLEHPGHSNQGKGASRNLGICHAQGNYVAFLDADDIWLPNKLTEQAPILDAHPDVGMVYGNTRYWHSWTGRPDDRARDSMPLLGVPTGTVVTSPTLLARFLRGQAAVPCTCSLLVRRTVLLAVNGFEEDVHGISNLYEDQALYAKIVLATPVIALDSCTDWYRQHQESSSAVAQQNAEDNVARLCFLNWLATYLSQHNIVDAEVWQALQKEQWLLSRPAWLPLPDRAYSLIRWGKKWRLRLEERLLPQSLQNRLWLMRPSYCEQSHESAVTPR